MLQKAVYLSHCTSYDRKKLQLLLQAQLDSLNVPIDFSGRRVFLKPNLISAGAPSLACSSPLFVAAVAACFLERGARVLLGDSPAFGTAAQVLQRQGFLPALSGLAVEYVPFRNRIVKRLECGISIGVAAEPLGCDYFVNLPRVKAHEQMGVTMAVKNVFGIVLGARKAWLHMRYGNCHADFAQIILDLQKLLPETLVIADGIEVMNRRGPMKGSSLHIGCLAVARNGVALDRAMLEVLEIETKRVPLALAAEKQRLNGAMLEELDFPNLTPKAFSGSGFRIPATLSPVRFRIYRYLRNALKKIGSGMRFAS